MKVDAVPIGRDAVLVRGRAGEHLIETSSASADRWLPSSRMRSQLGEVFELADDRLRGGVEIVSSDDRDGRRDRRRAVGPLDPQTRTVGRVEPDAQGETARPARRRWTSRMYNDGVPPGPLTVRRSRTCRYAVVASALSTSTK